MQTQYGNILRLLPSGSSPLLLPANEHRQLIVIDFEYAGANVPGLEFANHFSEWCYDYYDPDRPYALTHSLYPSIPEQERFIRAYITHGLGMPPPSSLDSSIGGEATTAATTGGGSVAASLAAFTIDARTPYKDSNATSNTPRDKERPYRQQLSRTRTSSSSSLSSQPQPNITSINSTSIDPDTYDPEQAIIATTNSLMRETRLWRPANTAQWVAWGIVQATIPELADNSGTHEQHHHRHQQHVYEQEGKLERGVGVDLDLEYEQRIEREEDSNTSGNDGMRERLEKESWISKIPTAGDTAAAAEGTASVTDFDYLSYARDRAMLFWGDLVAFGLVDERELPRDVRARLKLVEN